MSNVLHLRTANTIRPRLPCVYLDYLDNAVRSDPCPPATSSLGRTFDELIRPPHLCLLSPCFCISISSVLIARLIHYCSGQASPHARFMSWYSRNIVGLINIAMPRIPNSVPFCTIMLPHSPLLLSLAVNTPRSHLSSNIPVVPVGLLFHCFTLIIPSRSNSLPSSLLRSQPNSRYPLTLDIPHPHSLYSLLHLTFPRLPHFLIYSVSSSFSHASLLKRISQNTALSIVFHSSTLSLAIVILLFSIQLVFTWLSLSFRLLASYMNFIATTPQPLSYLTAFIFFVGGIYQLNIGSSRLRRPTYIGYSAALSIHKPLEKVFG